jgi:hypothetical protein
VARDELECPQLLEVEVFGSHPSLRYASLGTGRASEPPVGGLKTIVFELEPNYS